MCRISISVVRGSKRQINNVKVYFKFQFTFGDLLIFEIKVRQSGKMFFCAREYKYFVLKIY